MSPQFQQHITLVRRFFSPQFIRVVVAALLTLSSFFVAQQNAVAQNSAIIDQWQVDFTGSSVASGNTTYSYSVCRRAGNLTLYDLDRFTLGIPDCLPAFAIESSYSSSPASPIPATIGIDPLSAVHGISFESNLDAGCRTYSVTYTGVIAELGPINVVVKAGAGPEVGILSGPKCLRAPTDSCGLSAPADVVIMLDRTGSISAEELAAERNAAKSLLNEFSTATERPRVAIGYLRGGMAQIATGGQLTSIYGNSAPATGLYAVINAMTDTSGNTDIEEAVTNAQAHLQSGYGDPQTPNYIILLSDGRTNLPSTVGCTSCFCANARNVAQIARDNAVSALPVGTKFFAIYFGGAGDACSASDIQAGKDYMKDVISSGPAYFYEGDASNLPSIFDTIANQIGCTDGGFECGRICNDNNLCVENPCPPTPTPSVSPTPTPSDSPTPSPSESPSPTPTETPTPSPTPSESPTPSPSESPSPTPTETPTPSPTPSESPSPTPTESPTPSPSPSESPSASPSPSPTFTPDETPTPTPTPIQTPTAVATPTPTPTVSIECVESDITNELLTMDGNAFDQKKVVLNAVNYMQKLSPKDKRLKKVAAKLRAQAQVLYIANWNQTWIIPTTISTCNTTSPLCVTSDHSDIITTYDSNARDFVTLTKTALDESRKLRGYSKKKGIKIYNSALQEYATSISASKAVPKTTTVCSS